jgi:hypothetical protein
VRLIIFLLRKSLAFVRIPTHPTANDRTTKPNQTKPRQDKTRQDKTRQDKTRQDKTRQDKTRQDKTMVRLLSTKDDTPNLVLGMGALLDGFYRCSWTDSCRDFQKYVDAEEEDGKINLLTVDWMYGCDDIRDDETSRDTARVDGFRTNVSCMDGDDAETFVEQEEEEEDDQSFLDQQYDFRALVRLGLSYSTEPFKEGDDDTLMTKFTEAKSQRSDVFTFATDVLERAGKGNEASINGKKVQKHLQEHQIIKSPNRNARIVVPKFSGKDSTGADALHLEWKEENGLNLSEKSHASQVTKRKVPSSDMNLPPYALVQEQSEVSYMDCFSVAAGSDDLGSLLLLESCLIEIDDETIAERILEHNASIEDIVPPDDYSDVDIHLLILSDVLADGAYVYKRSSKRCTPDEKNRKRRPSYDKLKLVLRKLQEKERKQLKCMSQRFRGVLNRWWIQRCIDAGGA